MGTDIHTIVQTRNAFTGAWENSGAVFPASLSIWASGGHRGSEHFTLWGDDWKKGNGETGLLGDPSLYRNSAPWDEGRNYVLFAFLADVRNGSGFAGSDTGDRLAPLFEGLGETELRGFPENFVPGEWIEEGAEYDGRYMGDHSFNWYTLRELAEGNWFQTITKRGVINIESEAFAKFVIFDAPPEMWSASIVGADIITISQSEARQYVKKNDITRSIEIELPEHLAGKRVHVKIQWETVLAEYVQGFLGAAIPNMMALAYRLGKTTDEVRLVMGFDS